MDRPLTRPRAMASALLCLWASGVWTVWAGPDSRPSPATATAPAPAKALINDSLTHQARSLGHLRDGATVGRAGRIMALLKCADRLVPGRPQTAGPMVDLYEGLGDLERAAASARVCVDAHPTDYAMGLRWLRLAQAISPGADKRIALLAAALDRKDLDWGIRAAAGVDLCGVYLRQADKKNAAAICARALQLDPMNSALLEARARLDGLEGQAVSFEIALAAVRGSPRSLDAAWKVAQRLQGAGVYASALRFYENAVAIAEATRPGDAVVEALHVDRFNAALDAAGKPEEAIKAFTPALNAYPRSLPLRALMVEAARLAGQDQEIAKHVQAMAKVYEPLSKPAARRTAAQSAELAWFGLYYRSSAKEAIRWAQEAARSAGGDRFVQRVLGACELANGDTAAGRRRLEGLVGKDPFAAAILARHYYDAGQAGQGAKTLQAGIGTIRTGPGWRALAALAAEKKVPVPPPAHAQAVKAALARLPPIVLEMGRTPEKFFQVKLAASPVEVVCGQAIRVDVELKNVSVHRLPLGQQGLFYPVVFLSVTADRGANKAVFPNLTRARLPAPKVLAAGASVRQTVRLDVGPAEKFLMADPLTDLKLTVTGLLDPLQEADKFISSVPQATIAPVTIRRKGLFDPAGDVEAAKAALGRIVRDIRKADPATQLRAARQTVSLLAHVRRVEKRQAKPVFPNLLQKSLVLALTKALAESPAEAVQAEVLAGLHHVDLDEPTIAQVAPCLQSPSPIVRMRLVELLVAKKTPGHETVLDMFAKDDDRLVREMAAAVSAKK